MTAYFVAKYKCDECGIDMPEIEAAPGGPIQFVRAEMERHNSREHGEATYCGGRHEHAPHWYGDRMCGGV